MTLLQTSLLNAVAVVIRMLTLLGLNKVLAVYAGPAGYAAIGQLQNAIQMATTLSSGAFTNGITKYTAEYHDQPLQQRLIWQTAGSFILILTFCSMVLIWGFSEQLASLFLQNVQYSSVFKVFAVALLLFSLNAYLLAILHGRSDIRRYIVVNIVGSILTFLLTAVAAWKFALQGALFALAIQQSLTFFVTLIVVWRQPWFVLSDLFGKMRPQATSRLSKFMAMALTTAICVPLSQIYIRDTIGQLLSWENAGMWEAMNRLSAAYLLFVTTTLSLYYLPKLASLTEFRLIRKEILQGYRLILPLAILAGCAMYLLREFLITALFSTSFLPMENLFKWQLLGDTLKIGSWLLAYLMLSKAMTSLYITTEIVFAGLLCLFSLYGVSWFGLEGAVMAYALNYLLYWITMGIVIPVYLRQSTSS
jgi:polysaccharide transporter, PST family